MLAIYLEIQRLITKPDNQISDFVLEVEAGNMLTC
jgi:hypothetical protein